MRRHRLAHPWIPQTRSPVFFALILLHVVAPAAGCASNPIPASIHDITSAAADLDGVQADAREAATSLKASAKAILHDSTTIRSVVGIDPLAPRITPQLDRIDAGARNIQTQAAAIDPGLLARLESAETAARHAADALEIADKKADSQARRIAELESLTSYIPWAVALIVAGCVGMAIKLHPALAWVPGELGAGIAASGLLLLVFILTWATHPWIIIGGGVAAILAILAPTIIRLNTHPLLNPATAR